MHPILVQCTGLQCHTTIGREMEILSTTELASFLAEGFKVEDRILTG